jgi:hypothetical protein
MAHQQSKTVRVVRPSVNVLRPRAFTQLLFESGLYEALS